MGARFLRFSTALAAGLATVSLSLSPASAAIDGVSAMPAKVAVSAIGPASVAVAWNVERSSVDLPNPGTISSPNLRILIGGAVAATLPRSLTTGAKGDVPLETIRIREVVQIPQALVYRAVKEGSSLTVRRTFFDSFDNSFEDAQLEVRPSGEGSTALAVQRLELTFDDDARSKVTPKGSALHGVAQLNTSGTGLISGQWEAADSTTTAGAPVFRILSLVRQGVAGGGRTVITSPPLPTATEGTHLVRFRIVDPAFTYETPVLQYYVTSAALAQNPAVQQQVLLTAPRPGAVLNADTRFAWSAVPGANAYQIAFYATPAGPAEPLDPAQNLQAQAAPEVPNGDQAPLAGIFVAGGQTEATLAPFTLAQLPADRSYLWKVIAIDGNGAVIGSSSIREIHKP